eukprot:1119200-Alexandrium_andersonii.AAC.1
MLMRGDASPKGLASVAVFRPMRDRLPSQVATPPSGLRPVPTASAPSRPVEHDDSICGRTPLPQKRCRSRAQH